MTRAWRIEYEGALYHLLLRKSERCQKIIEDINRILFRRYGVVSWSISDNRKPVNQDLPL